MPRNSSGIYQLPAGNPVAAGTLIESVWANTTLSDLAQAMSDSLDRFGRSTMAAPMLLNDGTAASPGLAFGAESSTGLYRKSSHVLAVAVAGQEVADFTAAGILAPLGFTGSMSLPDGTATAPALLFTSDTNVGLYRAAADDLGVVVNGADALRITPAQVNVKSTALRVASAAYGTLGVREGGAYGGSGPAVGYQALVIESNASNTGMSILAPDASASGIAFGDTGSPQAGLIYWHNPSDTFRMYVGGTSRLAVSGASIAPAVPILAADDSVSNPAYSWGSQTATGMFRPAQGHIGFATAGAERARITSAGFGIGVTPTSALHVSVSAFTDCVSTFQTGASTVGAKVQLLFKENAGGTTLGAITQYGSAYGSGFDGAMTFTTGSNEKARFTPAAQGELLVNMTAPGTWSSAGRGLIAVDGSGGGLIGLSASGTPKGYLWGTSSSFIVSGNSSALLLCYNNAEVARVGTDSLFYYTTIGGYGAQEIGFRSLIPQSTNTGRQFIANDRGCLIIQTASGAQLLMAPSTTPAWKTGDVVTAYNASAGNVPLTISGVTQKWGTLTGARTLAAGGIVTYTCVDGASNTFVLTGSGIS